MFSGIHFGMDKTTERVSSEYYWVGITNSVRKMLHSCDTCLARGAQARGVRSSTSNTSLGTVSNPIVTINRQENGIKVEMEMGEAPDIFFIAQEMCSYFWQRVRECFPLV